MFRNSVTSVDILLVSCSLLLLPPDCSGCDSWCPSLVEPQVLQGQAASEDISGCCQLHGFPGGDGGPSLPQVAPWEEAQTCSLRNGLSSTLILGSVLRPLNDGAGVQVQIPHRSCYALTGSTDTVINRCPYTIS